MPPNERSRFTDSGKINLNFQIRILLTLWPFIIFFWARLRNTSVHFKENLPPGAFLTSFAHIKPPCTQKYATKSMPKCSSHHSESNGVPNFPYKIFLCPGKLQTHPNAEPPSNRAQNSTTKQHQTHLPQPHIHSKQPQPTNNAPQQTAQSSGKQTMSKHLRMSLLPTGANTRISFPNWK